MSKLSWVSDKAGAAWRGIKKLPRWAFIAFLLLGAVIVYTLKAKQAAERKNELAKSLLDLEAKYVADIEEARSNNDERAEAIEVEYKQEKEAIEVEEKDLQEQLDQGIVGTANAWADYWKESKDG